MGYEPQPPDNKHVWHFDVAIRDWFYLNVRSERVYHSVEPRVVRPEGWQQFQPANAQSASNYHFTPRPSQPIPIRAASTAQPGPIRSPNSAQVGPFTGFSQSSQSPGGSRLQSQHASSGPSVGGASPSARQFGSYVPGSPQAIQVLLDKTASSRVTEGQQEELDKEYQVRKRPRKFFRLGKVFLMVHTELFGNAPGAKQGKGKSTVNTFNKDVFLVAYGERVFSKVRRFIVVSEQEQNCCALAITTHSGKGAAQKNASEHGIVYTGKEPPPPLNTERGMLTAAIRIDPFEGSGPLHKASRVNYAKTYTIEHNVKVKPYGTVNNLHMHHLFKQWTEVLIGRSVRNPARIAFAEISVPNLEDLGFDRGMMRAVLAMKNRSKGRSADARTLITSVARSSAELALQDEQVDAKEDLADQVVEMIIAGMTYPLAVERVRELVNIGDCDENENAAVGEGDDDEVEDESEAEDDDDDDSDEAGSEEEVSEQGESEGEEQSDDD